MKKLFILSLIICSAAITISAQPADSSRTQQAEREYSFLVVDAPARLYTMRQSNENYLSAYRLAVRGLNSLVSRYTSTMIQAGAAILLVPLTHEEAHRSVLTCEKIGSVSMPYINKHFAAYVIGVRDAELQNLRDTKFPDYIRLHVAGVESDYALALRANALLSWNREDMDVLWIEYFMRKLSLTSYYAMGLFKMDPITEEEPNELDRDIVGHDIYGAIRHLHRPTMEFYRYTSYDNLSGEEQQFVKRVGWRSLLNLADPLLFGKNGFTLKNGHKLNAALGYGMAPFGDFIDQRFWWATSTLNLQFYIREYENRQTWFPAAGAGLGNFAICRWLLCDAELHAWQQPTGLNFNTTSGTFGGAIEATLKYKFYTKKERIAFSLNLGITAKTEGYLIEEAMLDRHVGLRFGASLWLGKPSNTCR